MEAFRRDRICGGRDLSGPQGGDEGGLKIWGEFGRGRLREGGCEAGRKAGIGRRFGELV
jgi:hypothetical protein